MLTVMQAALLSHGNILYHQHLRNSDGTPLRARVNGIPKILKLKSRRGEFSVPLKHGLYDHGYLTHENAKDWCLTEEDVNLHPLKKCGDWNLYMNKTGLRPTKFYCHICKRNCDVPTTHSCTTGYAIDKDNSLVCYQCAAEGDKQQMIRDGRMQLYLSQDKEAQKGTMTIYKVTNWPGSLEFKVPFAKEGKHNFARTRTDFWFRGPDDFIWHGFQIGNNNQVAYCKRTKATKF